VKLGLSLRLMGAAATPDILLQGARAAEAAGIDDLWVPDHIAIPPDDAEGSGGRYLDALASLAYLAAATNEIGLGTAVLILPYRPALPTAKWIATIQELSGGRLCLGVGIGWMDAEFRALGLERRQRAALADRTLDLLRRCFDAPDDVVEENGQPFLFRPHPPAPPIFVGGAGDHALARAVRYGDGWMPMFSDPEKLAPSIVKLHALAEEAGRPQPEVACFGGFKPGEPTRGAEQLAKLAEIGVTRFITGGRYETIGELRKIIDGVADVRRVMGA
jgi:probable F420-dependent oxidoreductase